MYRLLVCIADTHAPALLVLAGLICVGASFVSVVLLQRSQTAPRLRLFWLGAAGFTAGVGIWSTHFVAMLAYDPGIAVSYEAGWTVGSLAIAIAVATLAIGIARSGHSHSTSMAAGLAFGLAIAGTHNLGMLGVVIPGTFVWNTSAVLVSDVLGCFFAATAFEVLRRDSLRHGRVASVALFVTAIFALHFIGIGTLVAVPDPTAVAAAWVVPREMLAALIAALMLVVLIVGAAALWLDERMSAVASEVERLRQLADAAIEGIVVMRDQVIVDVNASLTRMLGRPRESLVGTRCADLLFLGGTFDMDQCLRDVRSEGRLLHADGRPLSVEMHLQTVAFPDGPREILAVRDVSERSAAEDRIRFLARHDPLTGLMNRSSLLERLEAEAAAADAGQRSFAIYYLDLDRFKEVNDTFGHHFGDELLKLVAFRLRSLLRDPDAIFRMGGDEFVMVQSEVTAPSEIGALAERIVEAMTTSFAVAGSDLTIGVSVGVARYPKDGRETDELLKFADVALYKAKDDGGRRVALFDPSMDAVQQERRKVEAELRRAIERDELTLVYQPQVTLSTGEVSAYEALLRWHSQLLGSIPPSRFIPIAEAAGLIETIGAWALRTACEEAATWTQPCALAVNLSPLQLQNPGLPALVQEALDRSGLDPRRLELEITETALIRDRERAALSINRLKAIGVRIALDDFGTGYSSLSYLQTFPFDTLKIDRCFVARLTGDGPSAAIVDSVVRLGHAIGLKVVAEGVETAEQLVALRSYGCDAVQGYLLGCPAELRCALMKAA